MTDKKMNRERKENKNSALGQEGSQERVETEAFKTSEVFIAYSKETTNATFLLAQSYYDRGKLAFEKEMYDLAVKESTDAIKLVEKFANDSEPLRKLLLDCYFLRGKSYYANGVDFPAIDDFLTVTEYDPHNIDAYKFMAEANLIVGSHDDAIKDLSTLIELNPKAEFYNLRGLGYAFAGKSTESQQDFQRSYQMMESEEFTKRDRASLADLHLQIALVEEDQDNHENVIICMSEAIRLLPNFIGYYEVRANAYDALGNVKEASQDRQKVAELTSKQQAQDLVSNKPESKNRKSKKRKPTEELRTDYSESSSGSSRSFSSNQSSSSSLTGEHARFLPASRQPEDNQPTLPTHQPRQSFG